MPDPRPLFPEWDQDHPPEPSISELVELPPTSELDQLQAEAAGHARVAEPDSPQKAFLERRAAAATLRYRWGLRRDFDLKTRRATGPSYADCFCLGQGGRRRTMGAMWPYGELLPITDEAGQPVWTWETFCTCPDGVAFQRSIEVARAAAGDRLRASRVQRLLGAAGIPEGYSSMSRESWLRAVSARGGKEKAARSILNVVRYWEGLLAEGEQGERLVLLLLGNYGTGKSTLGGITALEWAERERSVLYRSAPQLAAQIRDAPYRRETDGPPTADEVVSGLIEADLLVLDDLGSEARGTDVQAERVREWLLRVLDARAAKRRPSVVTTNLPGVELDERYGPRLADRLTQPSHAVVAVFDDALPNLRQPIGEPRRRDHW